MYSVLLLMGQQGGSGGQQGNPLLSFLPLVLIILIMWLLLLRPQAKRQKEHRKLLENLQKGDRIVTSGGLLGTIAGVKEKENILIIKIADNVKVEMTRSSVASVLNKKSE